MRSRVATISLFLVICFTAVAQQRVGVLLYDVGRLYDTIPSRFYNDRQYTPQGTMRWNSERYQRKISNITKVIDSIQMPIIILRGVENEQVVRDIIKQSHQDYSYLHRTMDQYDGLDFALLYYGDLLYINRVDAARSYLRIDGELSGHTISFHLTRQGSRVRTLTTSEPSDIDLLWGRFTSREILRLGAKDLLWEDEREGRGDSYNGRWYLNNRLGFRAKEGIGATSGIYISRWLLSTDLRHPLPTHSADGYWGGYSPHLPQYIHIEID